MALLTESGLQEVGQTAPSPDIKRKKELALEQQDKLKKLKDQQKLVNTSLKTGSAIIDLKVQQKEMAIKEGRPPADATASADLDPAQQVAPSVDDAASQGAAPLAAGGALQMPSTIGDLRQMMQDQMVQAGQERTALRESLAAQVKGIESEPSIDPWIKFLSRMSGEKLPEGYQSKKERLGILRARQAGLRKEESQRLDTLYKFAEARESAAVTAEEKAEAKADKERFRKSKFGVNILNKVESHARVKESQKILDEASNLRSIVEIGGENPIAAAAVPTFMARVAGEVGNLSEADKRPFGGDRSIMMRMEQALKTWSEGTLTEENKAFLMQFLDVLELKRGYLLKKRKRKLVDQYYAAQKEFTKEELYDIVGVRSLEDEAAGGVPPAAAQAPPPPPAGAAPTKGKALSFDEFE